MENIGRTNLGKILIFAWLEQDGERYKDKVILSDGKHILNEFYYFKTGEKIINHSKNIIDLIEEEDIIEYLSNYLGRKIKIEVNFTCSKEDDYKWGEGFVDTVLDEYITIDDIKTIVTKEQFEEMKYVL